MSTDSLFKFQSLLKTLFLSEYADLDFGIYRILNARRKNIEQFIDADLPAIVAQAFDSITENERAALRQEENRLVREVREKLDDDAIDADGQVVFTYANNKLAKQYTDVRSRIQDLRVSDAMQHRVYNDLFTFFNRYYDDGDFMPLRRRGRGETYAVPYNGEEVMLHWANRDQYYIKSGDRYNAYRFTVDDVQITVEITSADVATNNNKKANRYYVLAGEDAIRYDAEKRVLSADFAHRPLSAEEETALKDAGKTASQDTLNEDTQAKLLAAFRRVPDLPVLTGSEADADAALFKKRLAHFTRRNTSDFFIHKDLRGFLTRELDFYIKNDVLLLDELLAPLPAASADAPTPTPAALPPAFRRARALRLVADRVIDFLATVEEFQKRLFEKRKFVLASRDPKTQRHFPATRYAMTLHHVPETLWDVVLANREQTEEWQELYKLNDLLAADGVLNSGLNADFLRRHPALMVDTRHFDDAFAAQLLASIPDLDAATDGVCFNSDNYQALRLMQARYGGQVKCIYIDPPYNTGNDGFLYKDGFQHSTWLSMMQDRLTAGNSLLTMDGLNVASIDDAEEARIKVLLETAENGKVVAVLVWDKNRKNDARYFSVGHEYMLVYAKNYEAFTASGVTFREETEGIDEAKEVFNRLCKQYKDDWIAIRQGWIDWFRQIPVSDPRRRMMRYSKVGPRGPYREDGNISWPGGGGPHYTVLHPITKKPVRVPAAGWRYPQPERFQEEVAAGRISFGADERTTPGVVRYLFETDGQVMPSVFYSYAQTATMEFESLFGRRVFENPKSWRDIARMIRYLSPERFVVVDYFAGSGTTGHAVVSLNRAEPDSSRKYVLVEMGAHFDTVLVPRLKKAVFSSAWKDGKPTANDGIPHLLQLHTLEQYEDTLSSVVVDGERADAYAAHFPHDARPLAYVLNTATDASASLLNVSQLAQPSRYRLNVQSGDVPTTVPVDLQTTFHFLLGLRVKRLREYRRSRAAEANTEGETETDVVYRASLGTLPGQVIVTVWRDADGLAGNEAALSADAAFVRDTVLPDLTADLGPPDKIYLNGPHTLAGAENSEPEFLRLMWKGSGD